MTPTFEAQHQTAELCFLFYSLYQQTVPPSLLMRAQQDLQDLVSTCGQHILAPCLLFQRAEETWQHNTNTER